MARNRVIRHRDNFRQAMNGMLPYSVKIFICMTVNMHSKSYKNQSQCFIQKSSETAAMNICMCVRDGTSGVIYWWTGGHNDEEITQPTTLSIYVVSS